MKEQDADILLWIHHSQVESNLVDQEVKEERGSKAEKLQLMFPITEAELCTLEGTLGADCSLPLATRKATFKSLQIDENVLFKKKERKNL